MGRVILIASGKGGTGKTTLTANLGAALALRGKSTVVVDMDMGLRNLDVALGLESNIVYDVADIIENTCTLDDALIKHQSYDSLFFIPAPQTRNASAIGSSLLGKDEEMYEQAQMPEEPEEDLSEIDDEGKTEDKTRHRLKKHKVNTVPDTAETTDVSSPKQTFEEDEHGEKGEKTDKLEEIWKGFWSRLSERFDFCLIDSPAGIDGGFKYAVYGADEAVIVTLPETAALRDADRVVDVLEDAGIDDVRLVINRIRPDMISKGIMMNIDTCIDMLGIPILGIVGDDVELISTALKGELAVNAENSSAGTAFKNIAARLIGESVEIMSFEEKKSFWVRLKELFGINKR